MDIHTCLTALEPAPNVCVLTFLVHPHSYRASSFSSALLVSWHYGFTFQSLFFIFFRQNFHSIEFLTRSNSAHHTSSCHSAAPIHLYFSCISLCGYLGFLFKLLC
eukprot:c28373_g1_i1 orf=54-368(+)